VKSLAIVLLMFLLLSCRQESITVEQCSPYMAEEELCFCRQYRFSPEYVGPVKGSERDMPLSYCHKVVGFTATDYGKVASYWEQVRRAANRKNKAHNPDEFKERE
jgi:hypothetical protein